MGRVSTYSEEVAEEICRRAIMESMHKVCAAEDMPSEGTVYGWMVKHPEFAEKYARAREARAFRRYESADEVTEGVKSGLIDPAAARVLLDAIKWQTSKEAPKTFGDKLELSGNKEAPLTVNITRLTGEG